MEHSCPSFVRSTVFGITREDERDPPPSPPTFRFDNGSRRDHARPTLSANRDCRQKCRQRWGRSVAYASQFCDRINRAHRGIAKINARLCRIGGYDPDEWDLPPKPKWMRWRTYNGAEEKFDRYEAILDQGLLRAAIRLGFRP
jgi:hypothetical protein